MRITVDVGGGDAERAEANGEGKAIDPRRELRAAAHEEAAAVAATQSRAIVLVGASALVLVLAAGFAALWLDDRWQLSDDERWLLRVLLAIAAGLLVAAAVAALSAASPRSQPAADLAEPLSCQANDADQRRALEAVVAIAGRARADAQRRGRILKMAGVLFALAVAAVAAQGTVFAFVAGSSAEAVDPPPPKDALAELARAHAPLLWLHSSERFGPLDPTMLLAGARLRWRDPSRKQDPIVLSGIGKGERIGADCASAARGCARFGPYLPFQFTRPHLRSSQRPRRLALARGLYLDEPDRLRHGQLVPDPPVPVFFDPQPATGKGAVRVTYWLFFGFSAPVGRKPGRGHEGDWKRLTIEFDAKHRPQTVVLPARGGAHRLAWSKVAPAGTTHPVLYASLSSHELHRDQAPRGDTDNERICVGSGPARTCTIQRRNAGLPWHTWRPEGSVRRVSEQPWYGFGGAWGQAGPGGRSTGPVGPSELVALSSAGTGRR